VVLIKKIEYDKCMHHTQVSSILFLDLELPYFLPPYVIQQLNGVILVQAWQRYMHKVVLLLLTRLWVVGLIKDKILMCSSIFVCHSIKCVWLHLYSPMCWIIYKLCFNISYLICHYHLVCSDTALPLPAAMQMRCVLLYNWLPVRWNLFDCKILFFCIYQR
jgi:hypothetical protein